jgi:integrase
MESESTHNCWGEKWEGGRVWHDADGKPVYVIRKQVKGKRYEVSTRSHSHRAALIQLDRFDADPEGFDPRGTPTEEPIYLEETLSEEFLAWSKDEKKNTREWRAKQRSLLAWWAEKLHGVDLRRASLRDHLLPALKKQPARHHRISVIKALYTWLRSEAHRISTAEDPVYGQLRVPQAVPAQLKKSKVVPRDHVFLAIEQLTAPWREALLIQAGTGWHTTEVIRFAGGGSVEPLPRHAQQEGVAGVLVCPSHKSGDPHRTRVSREVLDAGKRLLAHGAFSREWYDRAVRAVCVAVKGPDGKVGIPVFTPGRLRHSVGTWAVEAGADMAAVSTFLGHKSPRTTKRFYATHASPAKVPTLA